MKLELIAITPDPEGVIELSGRICYNSKIGDRTIIQRWIKAGHETTIEPGVATFKISDVSRNLLAQITRHRIASFCVESQRYVSYDLFKNNKYDEHFFDQIDSKEKAYILGFLFADGNVYINEESGHYVLSMKLNKNDEYILHYIQNLIGKKNELFYYDEENTVKFQIGSKYMINVLVEKYGLIPNKSLIKNAKKVLSEIPKNLHKSFLHGYFDGNGSIGVSKGDISKVFAVITCYSSEFLQDLIENYEILSDRTIVDHSIKFQGKNLIFNFLKYLYDDIDLKKDIFLIRKFIRAIQTNSDFYLYMKERINDDFFVIPTDILNSSEALGEFYHICKKLIYQYSIFLHSGVTKEDARMILPSCFKTQFVFTINFRSMRNFFNLRLDKHAQWEIRNVANEMLKIVKPLAPNVFYDFEILEEVE